MKQIRNKFGVLYYNYDVNEFPFYKIISDFFKIKDLKQIHTLRDYEHKEELFTNNNDCETIFHQKFYKKINSGWPEFEELYIKFIKDHICSIFKENEIIYQSKPTFRIQFPNNIAVGGSPKDTPEMYGWHKDTDDEYNHPNFEKNFIVPLTDAKDTSSVFIETAPNSNKFHSADMKLGEFFQFRGGECIHGNKPNKTGLSRVSFDFRIVLKKDYSSDHSRISKLSGKKFTIGNYYDIINTNEF